MHVVSALALATEFVAVLDFALAVANAAVGDSEHIALTAQPVAECMFGAPEAEYVAAEGVRQVAQSVRSGLALAVVGNMNTGCALAEVVGGRGLGVDSCPAVVLRKAGVSAESVQQVEHMALEGEAEVVVVTSAHLHNPVRRN
jgi:hypothetical protein